MKNRMVISLTNSLGALSKKWLRRTYPFRKRAVERLVARSGYTAPMAEALLDTLFKELTAPKLLKLLRAELGDPKVLDGFRYDPLTKTSRRAFGPSRILHIFASNVPNPAIVSFILGMLVKSENIGKVSSKDPGILDIYLDSLRAHDKRLAARNTLVDKRAAEKWMGTADLVIAYGNDATLKAIEKRTRGQFIGYGHRISVSIITKDALESSNLEWLAGRTAMDLWMMDRRGCLSPQWVLREKGGSLSDGLFERAVERHLKRLGGRTFHRQQLDKLRWIGKAGYFSGVKDLVKLLSPHRKFLQAASLETGARHRSEFADALSELGFNRICRAGQMQNVPLTWHHDGKMNLAGWLRWTDLEP